jgi:Flp pilus assembly CpaE family ATPase
VWGGVNVMLGAANASQFNQPNVGRGAAYAGVISGTGQVVLGALRLRNDVNPDGIYRYTPPIKSYAAERTVSYLNIGAGTATLALSAWNAISHRKTDNSRTAVGVVSFPGPAGGSGLSLTRRF